MLDKNRGLLTSEHSSFHHWFGVEPENIPIRITDFHLNRSGTVSGRLENEHMLHR